MKNIMTLNQKEMKESDKTKRRSNRPSVELVADHSWTMKNKPRSLLYSYVTDWIAVRTSLSMAHKFESSSTLKDALSNFAQVQIQFLAIY